MSETVLHAEVREATGKGYARKLRQQGKVPGIFYTHGEKSVPIMMDEKETVKVLTSTSGLIDFQIGKKKPRKVIIKEIQTDPVRQSLVHLDVMGVRLEEKITISVPIHLIGEAIGVKAEGGVLHQYLREVEVSCLPLDIPDHIDVDVTNLKLGDSISLGTLKLEKAEIVGDLDQPIVSISMPSVVKEKPVEEAPVAEGEAAAETAEGEPKAKE